MSDSLEQLVDQADQAAKEFKAPATVDHATQATDVTSYERPTMDSLLDGGRMSVDAFVRLAPDGFRIGSEMQGLLDDMTVKIKINEITPIKSARFETNGQTKFIKSYDGRTTPDGQNFANVVRIESERNTKSSGVYDTAEVPMTLVDDVKDPKKKKDYDAGTRVGYTPSITGFDSLRDFLKALRNKNPALLQEEVTVKVTHRKRTNSKNNEWGVLDFELVEDAA